MKYSIKKNTATEKLNRHWEFGIGAANPIAAMKTDFLEQLKYYKDEIGADYVRLGGTFTDSRTQTIFCPICMIFPMPESLLPEPSACVERHMTAFCVWE